MTRYVSTIQLGCVFAAVLYSIGVRAQEPLPGTETKADARSLAMSGAQRAFPSGTSAVYLNPATVGMSKAYQLHLQYGFTGKDALHRASFGVTDAVTSPYVAAGLAVDILKDSAAGMDMQQTDVRLALALPIRDVVFLGVTGRYLKTAFDVASGRQGPNGAFALPRRSNTETSGLTMDAGVAVRLGTAVNLGVVGYNLTKTESQYAPLQVGLGGSLSVADMWVIEPDIRLDFTTYDAVSALLDVGTEVTIRGQVGVRAGYHRNFATGLDRLWAGVGFGGNKVAVDFAYGQDIDFPSRFRLVLALRVFIA